MILFYWFSILVGSLHFFNIQTLSQFNRTHARKYFHLIALLLFIPVTFLDPNFMYNSYSIVLSLFLFSEWIRLSELYLISNAIHNFISPFFDEKDKGVLKISHISLLLGCSLSMWLSMEPSHPLLTFSGLAITGVGDAFASFCGKKYGRHKILKNGKKSWEGCLAGFVSAFLALWIFSSMTIPSLSWLQLFFAAITTFLCSLLEGITEQNDNIVVPLFYFSVLNFVFSS